MASRPNISAKYLVEKMAPSADLSRVFIRLIARFSCLLLLLSSFVVAETQPPLSEAVENDSFIQRIDQWLEEENTDYLQTLVRFGGLGEIDQSLDEAAKRILEKHDNFDELSIVISKKKEEVFQRFIEMARDKKSSYVDRVFEEIYVHCVNVGCHPEVYLGFEGNLEKIFWRELKNKADHPWERRAEWGQLIDRLPSFRREVFAELIDSDTSDSNKQHSQQLNQQRYKSLVSGLFVEDYAPSEFDQYRAILEDAGVDRHEWVQLIHPFQIFQLNEKQKREFKKSFSSFQSDGETNLATQYLTAIDPAELSGDMQEFLIGEFFDAKKKNPEFSLGIPNSWRDLDAFQNEIDSFVKSLLRIKIDRSKKMNPDVFAWILLHKNWESEAGLMEFADHGLSRVGGFRNKNEKAMFLSRAIFLSNFESYKERLPQNSREFLNALASRWEEELWNWYTDLKTNRVSAREVMKPIEENGYENFRERFYQRMRDQNLPSHARNEAFHTLAQWSLNFYELDEKRRRLLEASIRNPVETRNFLAREENIHARDFLENNLFDIGQFVEKTSSQLGVSSGQSCAVLCRSAYRLLRGPERSEFSRTEAAELFLRMLFISKMSSICEKIAQKEGFDPRLVNDLKLAREVMEKSLRSQSIPSYTSEEDDFLARYSRISSDVNSLNENSSSSRDVEVKIYTNLWRKVLSQELGVPFPQTLSDEFQSEIFEKRRTKTEEAGSDLTSYAYSSALLHVLDENEMPSTLRSNGENALLELLYLGLKDGNPRSLPYTPNSTYVSNQAESFGRVIPHYLNLYLHSSGAIQDFSKEALLTSVNYFTEELIRMPILAKYRGVHLSNYEDLKWTKDTRAPYYYYAAIPYYVAAIDFLLSDNTLSEDVKKELVRKKEMAELFFRFFLANPENSVLIHNDLSNDNVHYSYTSLLGLGVLSLTESCPEIEGAHVRQIFRNGRPDDAILRGLMPGVTRVNLAPPVSVEEHSAQEFKAELEKVERENSP